MQLLWSAPVKHYECVNEVKSTHAVPNFSVVFWGYKLDEKNVLKSLGKTIYWLWSEYSLFQETLFILDMILWNTLLCNRLVRRGQKVVQKKLIVFRDNVYIILSSRKYKKSAGFLFLSFVFLPESREMSKSVQQLLNTNRFHFQWCEIIIFSETFL